MTKIAVLLVVFCIWMNVPPSQCMLNQLMQSQNRLRQHLPYPPEIGEDPGKYRPLPLNLFSPRNASRPLAGFFRHPGLLRLLLNMDPQELGTLLKSQNAAGLAGR